MPVRVCYGNAGYVSRLEKAPPLPCPGIPGQGDKRGMVAQSVAHPGIRVGLV
jgi:hypothetical protein